LFVQVPFDAVSVWPTRGVPVIVGGAELTGAAATACAAVTAPAITSPATNSECDFSWSWMPLSMTLTVVGFSGHLPAQRVAKMG
jgi:hypothetical protein